MKKIFIKQLISAIFLLSFVAAWGFKNLEEMRYFASRLPEFPASDNEIIERPNFTRTYKHRIPNLMQRILNSFGLQTSYDEPGQFKTLLSKVAQARIDKNLIGNHVIDILVKPNDKIVLVGTLNGSFHSLVEILKYIAKENIIDENFKLKNPSYKIIFIGNAIDGSAYNITTLTAILKLIDQNPEKVFYIKGHKEYKKYWHDFSFKNEIKILSKHLSTEMIPFDGLIQTFFDSLPFAAYIHFANDPKSLIKVSDFADFETKEVNLNAKYFGNFFAVPKGSTTTQDINYKFLRAEKDEKNDVYIKILIKGNNEAEAMRKFHGLHLNEPELGATTWSVISSPTLYYQKLFNFHYDAFGIITFGQNLFDTALSWYTQDVKKRDGFKEEYKFNLFTGQQLEVSTGAASTKTQITSEKILRFGTTLGLSRAIADSSRQTKKGISIAFYEQNQKGGIDGTPIKIVVLDDEYNPKIARENVLALEKDFDINTLICPIGTRTLQKYLDLVKSGEIAVLFPITGALIFRDPALKNIVNLRPSYKDEARELMGLLFEKYNSKNIAVFYQDDAFGQACLEGAKEILKDNPLASFTAIPYVPGSTDFHVPIEKFSEVQTDAIGFFATAFATQTLIRQIGIDKIIEKNLFGTSDLAETGFRKFAKRLGLNFIISQPVPDPETSNIEIVKNYRNAFKNAKAPLDVFSLESFIASEILIDILKKNKITNLDQANVVKDKIIKSLENFKNYQFQGLTLNFDPKTRTISNSIWINDEEGKWILKSLPQS